MHVKIDTRAKFHAITIQETSLAANMTAELTNCILPLLQNDVKNAVVILKDIQILDKAAGLALVELQDEFYNNDASFVVCDLQQNVEKELKNQGILASLNYTPTESEAIDIVQMEEIERELLND